MSQQFTFPPPPPPPPSTNQHHSAAPFYPSQAQSWNSRGRGGYSAGPRGGRGGGGYDRNRGGRSQGQSGYSYAQRNGFRDPPPSNSQNGQNGYGFKYGYGSGGPGVMRTGHNMQSTNQMQVRNKRAHEIAFPRNSLPPKVQAAPSIPGYGFQLPPAPVPKAISDSPVKADPQKKRNLFGLGSSDTPSDAEPEDDVDEESRFAKTGAGPGAALSISYKGKLTTLRTPEDIAAWIAERKKNFPTKARTEIMKKKKAEEMAAREKERAEAKKKIDAIKADKKGDRVKDKFKGKSKPTKAVMSKGNKPAMSKEQLQIEKLKKAMEKNAKKLAELEAAAKATKNSRSGGSKRQGKPAEIATDNDDNDDSTTISSLSDDENTSSSDESSSSDSEQNEDSDPDSDVSEASTQNEEHGSQHEEADSESDSDAAPESVAISKAPIRVSAPARAKSGTMPLCRDLKNREGCTRKFCKFRHDRGDGTSNAVRNSRKAKQEQKPAGRISLYQRLLKQQIEEDERAEQEAAKNVSMGQLPVDVAPIA